MPICNFGQLGPYNRRELNFQGPHAVQKAIYRDLLALILQFKELLVYGYLKNYLF